MRTSAAKWSLRFWNALAGPARLRDSIVVILCALVCAGLIFGLLYDVLDSTLRRWTDRDLNRNAHLVGLAMAPHALEGSPAAMQRALDSLSQGSDVAGLIVCTPQQTPLASTRLGRDLGCRSNLAQTAMQSAGKTKRGELGSRNVAVTAYTIGARRLLVVQDRTFLDARRRHMLQTIFIAAELVLLAFILLARAGAKIGSRRMEEVARSVVRQMRSKNASDAPVPAEMRMLVRDMRDTVDELRNQRERVHSGVERLRSLVCSEIPSGSLVVIANREPYAHELQDDGQIIVTQPASGVVTGIEPILRACGGTWIGHAGGSADRVHADRHGRVAVPPDAPEYTLRRVWIVDDEYERYYSGLANEGLWPLCHMAHAQPVFRATDWTSYQSVNETFARAAMEETPSDGLLLIQDYHFALVPRIVRQHAPHVVTSLFWHIPWPNSEVVGICPWKEALLEGMIGADIVGFHTRQYCLNFLETAQRYLECRVDLEEMSVSYGGHRTLVRAYPISVEWPYPSVSRNEGAALRRFLGIPEEVHVSIGVDRADYTKGLIERVAAIETLLEENPSLIGKYVFVQLASPTRMRIRRYQLIAEELQEAVERVNARFRTSTWKPIVLRMKTFSPEEVRKHYAMADSAIVTPLHDGMNLVAKEYVAACDDGNGALVLSGFAGAAKELDGALIVNPYDTQQVAQAILRAILMPLAERKARMQTMRDQIASSSIYDWSAKLLTDMRDVRQQSARFWPLRVAARPSNGREVAAG